MKNLEKKRKNVSKRKKNGDRSNSKASVMSVRKMKIILGFVFVGFAYLIYKLVSIAYNGGDEYSLAVLDQRYSSLNSSVGIYTTKRGTIYDANKIPLAESRLVYIIVYDPKLISSLEPSPEKQKLKKRKLEDKLINLPEEINAFLYKNLKLEKGILERLLEKNKNSNYKEIAINLEHSECESVIKAIDSGKLPAGVTYKKQYVRKYPNNNLACDVIGYLQSDGVGRWGLEESYDSYLKGKKERNLGIVNEDNDFVIIKEERGDGYNLILNIDFMVQKYITEAMERYAEKYHPLGMEIIVMDPRDARVLGMASYPNFDLNKPHDLSKFFTDKQLDEIQKNAGSKKAYNEKISNFKNNLWKNGAIVNAYEPGSTFKSFTLAMALEEHKIDKETPFTCWGAKVPYEGEKPISCHKHSGHGKIDYRVALAQSCNVAFMDIGEFIGRSLFYDYFRNFGFGAITGIDLRGEISARELMYTEEKLNPVELQTSSFGQGFNITPIQLITSYCALINGGYLYEPRVVDRIEASDGTIIKKNEPRLRRVMLSREVSDEVRRVMGKVVEQGTGSGAAIKGYSIGGKTGTAEKNKRADKDYVVSFIGFSPVENPEVLALVVIDDPDKERVSSVEAVRVFKDMMTDVLPYLRVTKDYSKTEK